MFFWLREIAGWALLVASLFILRMGLTLVLNAEEPQIVEGGVILFSAGTLMRISVLLIRISTAARICNIDRESNSQT